MDDPLGLGGFNPSPMAGYRAPAKKAGPQKKKKSFLEDMISVGGSAGGAAGGLALGAAAGSVVPVVGTAIGGLIGAILGGAGGGALGQRVENSVVGDDLNKDVLQEGLLGGVGSVGPIRALTVGKALATGAGKQGVERAITATPIRDALRGVGKKGADTAKTTATGRLAESGNRALLRQYGTIDKPTTRTTNPLETVTQLSNLGITKPADAERVAAAITGSEGLLNQQVTRAVGNAADVDTSTLRRVFDDALDSYGLVDKDRASLQKVFDAQLKRVSGGARGSLNPKVNPTDALDMMKAIEKRMANLQGKGGNYRLSTPEREDQAAVLRLVRDELQDQIYQGAGANRNIGALLTPELRDNLVNLMPNNPKWQGYVDDTVMKSGDIGSLRSAQAPFVRIRNIIDNADANSIGAVGRASQLASGGGIRNAVVDAASNVAINPASRGYAAMTRGVTGRAGGVPGNSPLTPRGAATRAGLIGAAFSSGDAETPAPMEFDDPAMFTEEQATQETTNPFGVSSDEVAQLMMVALANGDNDGLKQLKTLYDLVGEYENNSATGGKNLTSQQATAVSKSDTALSALDRLENLYSNAGGGGRVEGTVAGLLGGLGANANAKAYNDQLAAVARYMGRAMGETGAGSDADAAAFISRLPKLTDTQEEARIKLEELRAMLSDSRKNLLYYGGGGADEAAAEL